MSSPAIVVVDDRPHGLAALHGAIARRFGADYRVLAFSSGREALDELARMRDRGDELALIIADQWMPEMTGSELLQRTHELYPDAQRALLVGWGDTRANETILEGCALGVLDNYILKPWSPEEVHLYPLVNEFLAEWSRMHRPRLELVRVISGGPSPRSTELRDLLERDAIPYGYYDAGSEAGAAFLARAGLDPAQVRYPVVLTLDGHVFEDPSYAQLADAFGVSDPGAETIDLAIVGGGPCGLAAAVYAASEGLRTVVVECGAIGGQAGASSLIRNFIGFPRGIAGADLAARAYQQAWLFGAKFVIGRKAIGLHAEDGTRIITLDDGRQLAARSVLIATGAEYRHLEVPRIERFNGVGVQYVAGADVALALRGHDVAVCGGGNSAGQAVVNLARTARRVLHVVRGPRLSEHMSAYLVREIQRLPNVELRLETEVIDADGGRGLEQITLQHRPTGTIETVPVAALFVMIGALPHTQWLHGVLARDRTGFILTGPDLNTDIGGRAPALLETSMPGVFAAGDVRYGSTKRLASAVGEGAVAIRMVHEYLRDHAVPETARSYGERSRRDAHPSL